MKPFNQRSESLTYIPESSVQTKKRSPSQVKAVEIYVDSYLLTEIVQDKDGPVLDKSRELIK